MWHRTEKVKILVPLAQLEHLLIEVLVTAIKETRRVQLVDKKGGNRKESTNAELIGEFCNWLRRGFKEHDCLSQLSNMTKPKCWSGVNVPKTHWWSFIFETTEGNHSMTAAKCETYSNVAAIQATNCTLEEEFREINAKMGNLFTEMMVLRHLNTKAVTINDEANVVLDNLCKVVTNLVA